MHPVVSRVTEYCRALGLDMTEGDYEDYRQLELTFNFDDCLATADRLTTYRQVCARVATELGIFCTFMPKPVPGVWGNGCHHNLSVWDGDLNLVVEEDRNDPHLTDVGRHVVGGLLAHGAGMTAIMAPTANSYVRFWEEGQAAPLVTNWGYDNKTCAIRVAGGRLEFKPPDSAVNPYLSHAAILAAVKDGLDNSLDPGPPQDADSTGDEARSAALAQFPAPPRTLGEAVEALEADDVIRAALPPELLAVFLHTKRDEWERQCGTVTDWQRAMYLNIFP
jgi:glutamine synthetase